MAVAVALVLWGVFGVQSDDRTGLRSVADTEALLSEIGRGHHLAYGVDSGVTLVDFDSGLVQRVAQYADELTALPPFVILYNGGHTIAIDPDIPDHLRVFVTGSRAIATDEEGTFAFAVIDKSTGEIVEVFIGRNDAAWIGQTLSIPSGSTLLSAHGVGLLVKPPGGGTMVPRLAEFEQISEGTVMAAVPGAWIEIRCDAGCQGVFVDHITGTEFVLPDTFDDPDSALTISPDSRWVVEVTEAASRFFNPRTGESVEIPGAAAGQFAWAPDSSYAVWLTDGSSAPVVHFAFTDGRSPIAVSLAALDAEPKVGDAVLVY